MEKDTSGEEPLSASPSSELSLPLDSELSSPLT